ncbi:MAG: S8 family peptidase, partial [Pirellulales bacterium]
MLSVSNPFDEAAAWKIPQGAVPITWQGESTYAMAGQWILGLDGFAGSPTAQLLAGQALLGQFNAQFPVDLADHLGANGTLLIETPTGISHADLHGTLAGLPGFRYVEPNFVVGVGATPNDPAYPKLYALNNTGQTGGTPDADIDAPEAWDLATGSTSVIVGVIDTGVDYTHPDLAQNIWTNPGEIAGDGIDNDGNGFVDDVHGYDFRNGDPDPFDDNGHGTHVSGTIGAVGDNATGVVGVNWNVSIMGLKFLGVNGSGFISHAIQAINYVTMMRGLGHNIRLTNNSWGSGGYSQGLYDAIAGNEAAGVLFVAAAGNDDGNNNDTSPRYPASFDLPNIIAVAATDHNDALATFSNIGPTSVDLAAPGVSILSTVPGGYAVYSGTSMATPHVAGAAALAASFSPGSTYQQIRDAIFLGADPKPSLEGLVATGGRLNAHNTLELLNAATPDLVVESARATGLDTVEVTYQVLGSDVGPFSVGFYQSADALFGSDAYLGDVLVDHPADLSVGVHTVSIPIGGGAGQVPLPGAGLVDSGGDYYLLAVLDHLDEVVETDAEAFNEDNTAVLTGAYLADTTVYAHGSAANDSITVAAGLTLSINSDTFAYSPTAVSEFRIRAHAGHDVISAAGVAKVMRIWGGDGDDTLTGGTLNDVIDGGAGFDKLAETAATHLTLSDTTLTGNGTDSLASIERAHLIGTSGANKLDASGFTGPT